MKTLKIGDRFSFCNGLYEVAAENHDVRGACCGCAASLDGWHTQSQQAAMCAKFTKRAGSCMAEEREDGEGVIFKAIKKNEDEDGGLES